MPRTPAISMMVICLLLGILIGYFAKTVAVLAADNIESTPYQKYPKKTILVKIATNQQEMFFDKLQKFAEDQGFAIRIAPTTPSELDYIVEMWREDIKIIALNSFDPGTFRIAFFDTESTRPTLELTLNGLVSEPKTFISEIPNVIITEEK